MLTIAISFVLTAIWLLLTPYNLCYSLIINCALILILFAVIVGSLYQKKYQIAIMAFSIILGISASIAIYLPALKDYQAIAHSYPLTISAQFKITSNQYESSTTIKLVKIVEIESSANEVSRAALMESSIRVYNIPKTLKAQFKESEIYEGSLSIRPRYFRNIPGDDQRILQALARKEIGYGKFHGTPIRIKQSSAIELLRNKLEKHFLTHYKNGAYISALSVGKTDDLTQTDWQILRKTGTVHLISISGLHLSLTAFYGFVVCRTLFGLLGTRKIQPYKFAAVSAIIIAFGYALIAGMSLPTIRAAIMFSIAMIALLIDRPIFSLQGVAIALLIISTLNPLSLLMPGFSLSFIAVIILILSARILTKPLSALILTQVIISLLLIPLTASFFGEVSIISPAINFFVIPWTSIVIMPFILIGTICLMISPALSAPFLAIADLGISTLKISIIYSAKVPYAAIITPKIPLFTALIMTLIPLFLLYGYPLIGKNSAGNSRVQRSAYFLKSHLNFKRYKPRRSALTIILLTLISLLLIASSSQIKKQTQHDLHLQEIDLYLMPVGEGLSLLFKSEELTFLYDTGNRFGAFDAGKNIILPLLRNTQTKKLDGIILSLQNQQHTGGMRTIREYFQETPIIGHKDLAWLIDGMQLCHLFTFDQPNLQIESITEITTSCSYRVLINKELMLYLISDQKAHEWRITEKIIQQDQQRQDLTKMIILYPNQGRREAIPAITENSDNNNIPKILLFSTQSPYKKEAYRKEENHGPELQYYNAYYGTVHLQIANKNAKPIKLRIRHYKDDLYYWWLRAN